MKNNSIFIGLIVALIVVLVLLSWTISHSTVDYQTVTVNEKERICTGNGDGGMECKYLIYTEQGVFENTDSLWHFKYNSSDLYNKLKEGQEYNIKYNGFRVPFLSMYQNILVVN